MRSMLATLLLTLTLVGAAVAGDTKRPTIEQVKATYSDDIMKLKGVVGDGVVERNGKRCLTIMVKDEDAKTYIAKLLAEKIEGYEVVVEVTGEIKPQ